VAQRRIRLVIDQLHGWISLTRNAKRDLDVVRPNGHIPQVIRPEAVWRQRFVDDHPARELAPVALHQRGDVLAHDPDHFVARVGTAGEPARKILAEAAMPDQVLRARIETVD
jgi:hypothetical protein